MKVLISGASRGIGLFLMKELIQRGFKVFGTYNKTKPEVAFADLISKVDVSDINQVKSWVTSIVEPRDKIVVINCAGTNYNAFAHKAEVDKWTQVINVNLIGSFNLIHSTLPYMRELGFGRIINFSSIVAQKGIPGTSAYAASKAALWGMSKSIAAENAKKGITINSLNLGYFDIGMITEVPDHILEGIKKTIPSQKLGNPEEILNTVMYLIENEYLNGTSLDINGGLY